VKDELTGGTLLVSDVDLACGAHGPGRVIGLKATLVFDPERIAVR